MRRKTKEEERPFLNRRSDERKVEVRGLDSESKETSFLYVKCGISFELPDSTDHTKNHTFDGQVNFNS